MIKAKHFQTAFFVSIITIGFPHLAFGYAGQEGKRKFVNASVYCEPGGGMNRSSRDRFSGVYDEFGFSLYHSHYATDDADALIYIFIEGKKPKTSFGGKKFVVKGEGVRLSPRGGKFDYSFDVPEDMTPEEMLRAGLKGYENKNRPDRRRNCKLTAELFDSTPREMENKIEFQKYKIAQLEKDVKEALENTTELDKAVADKEKLSTQIKELELAITSKNKSIKSLKADLSEKKDSSTALTNQITQKNKEISSLSKEIEQLNDKYRKLKANTPEKYAEASAKLVQLQKQLEFETNSKLELKSSLEQQKLTSGKLADEILRLEKLEKENKEKIAKLSQGESIISSLEEQLEQAQYQQKLLLDARDRVIAGQADELLKLEKAALTQSRQEQEKITALASEISLLREELADKDARLAKVSALFAGTSTNQNSSAALPTASQVKTPDLNKKWSDFDNVLSIQQKQFCALTERFKDELKDARASKNDIKINMVFKNRQDDLDALMPAGRFANWVFKIVKIEQVEDGSAAVVAQLECETLVGSGYLPDKKSGFFESDTKSWRATIPYNDRRYRELAKLSAGQFVAGSGSLLEIGAYKPGQPETFYASMPVGDHPIVSKLGYEGELFVADFSYLAALSD